MRNFLFAASFAEKENRAWFGVVKIAPARYSRKLREQVTEFRGDVLLPQFQCRISHIDYENYDDMLRKQGGEDAQELSEFLLKRIAALS
jgi:hypothetical protein